jgi:hypothetical protein
MVPEFNQDGFLPAGVHRATEVEVLNRFASSSARRIWLGEKLRDLLRAAEATGHLLRVFVWGSFVTAKESPNDLDILIVMDAAFDLAKTPVACRELFDHSRARVRFSADLFWTKASIGEETLQLWLDTYQTGRDFRRRGIIEVLLT